ncbi:MAG: hypothetical protein EXR72_24185 [Myxococcales bacterium]|nr:hypothetical protein [Myxococcales bacterium]
MAATLEFFDRSGDQVCVPVSAIEHLGFREWATSDEFPENLGAAWVDGEVILDMSPQELEGHSKVQVALTVALGRIVDDEDLGEMHDEQTLLSHEGAGLNCEPDLLFVSWSSFESGRVARRAMTARPDRYKELVGTPDLVVEVVSDSSVRKDKMALRAAYARAGIPVGSPSTG